MGWVGNKLIEPIRVRVLRFFAEKTIDAAVAKIEGDLVPGLVWLNGSSDQWEIIQNLPPLPIGRPPRVLLLVHGTFSTTLGSFAALEASGVPKGHFLSAARSEYDLVLGFDHKTLALDPKQNAQQILDALNFLPDGTVIDAIAFSRGGLVFRSLAERLAKETNSGLQFRKTVFVGCTNSGTNLAEPDNWDDLVGLYTNIGLGGARALSILGSPVAGRIAREAIKIMGGFVQAFPELAIKDGKVPGLPRWSPMGSSFLNSMRGRRRSADTSRSFPISNLDRFTSAA